MKFIKYLKSKLRLNISSFKTINYKNRRNLNLFRFNFRINFPRISQCFNYYNPKYRYTIVSACYNVEDYIDEFIASVVHQSIRMHNIQLVLIDDGSTDNTKDKIDKWVKKYPRSICYKYQSNSGQAAARNAGLKLVRNEWVNFADPDDVLHPNFFENIDRFLRQQTDKAICLVNVNMLPFLEANGKVFKHILSYKFQKGNQLRRVEDIDDYITMSASTSLFLSKLLKDNIFSVKCKPCFEDSLFVNKFLQEHLNQHIAFISSAIYFYRKRENKSSTMDRVLSDERFYGSVIKEGPLKLVEDRKSVPLFIPYVLCYDTYWHITNIIKGNNFITSLSTKKKEEYLQLLLNVYQHIPVDVIYGLYSREIINHHNLIGLLNLKGYDAWDDVLLKVEGIRNNLKILLISTTIPYDEEIIFHLNENEVIPLYEKTIDVDLLGKMFYKKKLFWLHIDLKSDKNYQLIASRLNKKIIKFKSYNSVDEYLDVNKLLSSWKSSFSNGFITDKKFDGCWLISDREIQADDNGEHFYRWIAKNHPEQKIFFLLNKDSHDWNRLSLEGFRLISYGSYEHYKALSGCVKLISSHADGYVTNYFKDTSSRGIDFIFLQHGIVKDDLSGWLNTKNISIIVSSSKSEYQSFIDKKSNYKLSPCEVKLVGLPRYDSLKQKYEKMATKPDSIVIMPTWRNYLMGPQTSTANKRLINKEFMNSLYAKKWSSFLGSIELKQIAEKYNLEVVFFPHANIQPYLSFFQLPDHVKVLSHKDITIQSLFLKSYVTVTDYSSAVFDVAFLKKPIIYYQFDREEMFLYNKHTYKEGYFNYEKDGFGPVCTEQEVLLNVLNTILENNGKVSPVYLDRMESFFEYNDGYNCERLYDILTKQ